MPVDPSKRQILKATDLDRFKPILYTSLYIPSWVNGYSIGMEFIYNYFLSRFPKDFFRTIHIAGKSSFDDFRRFEYGNIEKRENPACVIQSSIQYDFNDNDLDVNMLGINKYLKRSTWQRSFFKDPVHKLYISFEMELMLINFTIRTRYDTRSQQLDAYNRMRKLFRIGFTETIDTDMDIHIPYELMVQLAIVAGFDVDNENNAILDPWNFTKYLNSYSQMPILYKLRYVNGKYEFFVRMRNLPIHLNMTQPLEADDGEASGQTMTNFNIEMQVAMRLPIPKIFVFYNEGKWVNKVMVEPNDGITVYSMRVYDIPEANYKGWPMYGHSNYVSDEDEEIVKEIDISELFIAPVDIKVNTSLNDIINDSLDQFISPDAFVDVALYTNDLSVNNNGRLPIKMEWTKDSKKIILPENTINSYFYIAVYIDRLYLNSKITQINNATKNRIQLSEKTPINHRLEEIYDTEPYIEDKKYTTNFPKK